MNGEGDFVIHIVSCVVSDKVTKGSAKSDGIELEWFGEKFGENKFGEKLGANKFGVDGKSLNMGVDAPGSTVVTMTPVVVGAMTVGSCKWTGRPGTSLGGCFCLRELGCWFG